MLDPARYCELHRFRIYLYLRKPVGIFRTSQSYHFCAHDNIELQEYQSSLRI